MMVIGIVAAVIAIVVILLSLKYHSNQALKCPVCQLDFTADLFLLGQSTLISCPFCHQWLTVIRTNDKNDVRRLFEGIGRQGEENIG